MAEFPEEAAGYTLEELEDRAWRYILDDVLERDGAKGVRMWRALLDAAGPRLGSDPELAEELLVDWDVLNESPADTAEKSLAALEDDRFAGQVLQGAYVGNLQRSLLALCRKFGRAALPGPGTGKSAPGQRSVGAEAAAGAGPRRPAAEAAEAVPARGGGTRRRRCVPLLHRQLPKRPRPYAYLTGGLPVKVGDWVEAPFGRDNLPRRGQVISVADCTRPAASWPPERTKTVLRLVEPLPPQEDAPPEPQLVSAPEPVSAPVPEPGMKAEPPSAPEEKPAPVPQEPPQTPAAPAEEGHPAESDSAPARPDGAAAVRIRRRAPWKTICGVCAACAVLIGISGGAVAYHRWDARHRQAEQALLAGDISAAAEQMDRIPAFFRSERLVRYTELCALAQSGTEEALEAALEGIGQIMEESGEPLRSAMGEQYDAMDRQYRELLYQMALDQLWAERFDRAEEYLRQVPEHPYAAELLRYAQAGAGADPGGSSADLESALSLLEQVPAGYEGPFADEMAALRAELGDLISEAATRKRRSAPPTRRPAGPTVKPPHTLNYGGTGGEPCSENPA